MSIESQSTIKSDVAAVVVLYFPDKDVYDNIMSFYDQVDVIILVDNSDIPDSFISHAFAEIPKVILIHNKANFGIAAALNQGAREAKQHKCAFLLTMDQDSRAIPGMVNVLKELFSNPNLERLAIASPLHLTSIGTYPSDDASEYEIRDTVWTSGNLLSLAAYDDAGAFAEELFIDFVDHEYCLRLRRLGYQVVQSNKTVLHHNIGTNLRSFDVLFLPIIVSNHSPLRRYYIMRNRLWVAKHYPEFKRFIWVDRRRIIAEIITIFLYEDEKIDKFKMMVSGLVDYLHSKMGKYGSISPMSLKNSVCVK